MASRGGRARSGTSSAASFVAAGAAVAPVLSALLRMSGVDTALEEICADIATDLFIVSPEFVGKCRSGVGEAAPRHVLAERVKTAFFTADIRDAGRPFIEEAWAEKESTGEWVLQCDEIVNISLPLGERYAASYIYMERYCPWH